MARGDEEDVSDPTPVWVVEQLVRLGFSPASALELEENGVDYRKVKAAIDAGCTVELAAEIFL